MKRQFIFLISPEYKGEFQFEDILSLCLLRVGDVRLSMEEELNEITEKIDCNTAISAQDIQKYKKEISEKMKINILQDGSLECRIEMDI
jgi:hypothetical protein